MKRRGFIGALFAAGPAVVTAVALPSVAKIDVARSMSSCTDEQSMALQGYIAQMEAMSAAANARSASYAKEVEKFNRQVEAYKWTITG